MKPQLDGDVISAIVLENTSKAIIRINSDVSMVSSISDAIEDAIIKTEDILSKIPGSKEPRFPDYYAIEVYGGLTGRLVCRDHGRSLPPEYDGGVQFVSRDGLLCVIGEPDIYAALPLYR